MAFLRRVGDLPAEPAQSPLEEAFLGHIRSAQEDGDAATMSADAAISLLAESHLFDEWLTPSMVWTYCTYLADGCNELASSAVGLDAAPGSRVEGLTFPEFEALLRWAADMKGTSFECCAAQVVDAVTSGYEGASCVRRKLEIIFQRSATQAGTGRMTPCEFAGLCMKFDLLQEDCLCVGDIYAFFVLYGDGSSVDFPGFLHVLAEVGTRTGIGPDIYGNLADQAFKGIDRAGTASPKAIKDARPQHTSRSTGGGHTVPRSYAGRFEVSLANRGWRSLQASC